MNKYLLNYLRGIVIGFGEIVPGLGASTLSYAMGIYRNILDLIVNTSNFVEAFFKWIFSGSYRSKTKLSDVFALFDWGFGLPLFFGALTVVITLGNFAEKLFTQYPNLFYAFVTGCIIAVAGSILFQIHSKIQHKYHYIILATSTILSFLLLGLTSNDSSNSSLVSVAIAGFVAAIALVLPGLSFTLILSAFGMYEYLLPRVNDMLLLKLTGPEYMVITVFMICTAISVFFGSKILGHIYDKHHIQTQLMVCGLLLGSLLAVNPYTNLYSSSVNTPWIQAAITLASFAVVLFIKQKFKKED